MLSFPHRCGRAGGRGGGHRDGLDAAGRGPPSLPPGSLFAGGEGRRRKAHFFGKIHRRDEALLTRHDASGGRCATPRRAGAGRGPPGRSRGWPRAPRGGAPGPGAKAGGGSARRFLEHALENGRKAFGGGQTRGETAPVVVVVVGVVQLLIRIRIRTRMLAVPGAMIITVGLKLCSRWIPLF